MERIANYLMYVLIAIGVIVFLMAFVGESYNPMLYYAYALLGLALVGGVLGSVMNIITKPESLKKTGISVGFMLVVLLVSYSLASDEVLESYPDNITATQSLWSGVGLMALYIMFFGACAAIIFSGVYRIIKK